MKDKIVVIDFAGTLIKPEVIEEANILRANLLKKGLPSTEDHSRPTELYKTNREFVEQLTGLKKDTTIKYRMNNLQFIELSGEDIQNQISTNLFQIGMYMAAKKHGANIFQDGLIEQLQRIQELDYKLAIISGVRTDIISGMLAIANTPISFDYIFGQPSKLGVNNQNKDINELKVLDNILFVLGDKLSDLERISITGCKSIFVRWGHGNGNEEQYADYTISAPKELEKIIY